MRESVYPLEIRTFKLYEALHYYRNTQSGFNIDVGTK